MMNIEVSFLTFVPYSENIFPLNSSTTVRAFPGYSCNLRAQDEIELVHIREKFLHTYMAIRNILQSP